jgi:polygalacturonase
LDYGGIPGGEENTPHAFSNAHALTSAILAANSSATDKTVLIPGGQSFIMMPIYVSHIYNVDLVVNGTVYASQDYESWNYTGNCYYNFWEINDSGNLTVTGSGVVDGQGFWWWMREYLAFFNLPGNKGARPHLVIMNRVKGAYFSGVKYQNSPSWHLRFDDVEDFLLENFEIYVNSFAEQRNKFKIGSLFWFWQKLGLPTYALNTDGIDPVGKNVVMRNLIITSMDDAIAVKPGHSNRVYAKCSENIIAENITVYFGVGMTIGSVPPSGNHACIRDVTFRNVTFYQPFKAVYVKTNPGEGDGVIENILYEDLKVKNPLWWGIYIGPQQQKQPDGGGPGCMIYPCGDICHTQPRISVRNITLHNVDIRDGLFPPGVIRCNMTNPCTDFTFDNVKVSNWLLPGDGFITENVLNSTSLNSHPDPNFNQPLADYQDFCPI